MAGDTSARGGLLRYEERLLRYETGAILCRARRRELQWLREFLVPAFEELPAGAAEPAALVELADGEAHGAIANDRPESLPERIDAFVLERGVVRLPCWRSGARRIVADDPLGVFYEVDEVDGLQRIRVTGPGDSPRARVGLLRAVRELAMSEARSLGRARLHAAVVAFRGRGVLIAGAKRAGKTTVLLQALRAGGSFVSNDRVVLVSDRSGRCVARGMPTIVRIRPPTVGSLPAALREPLASGRLDHLVSLEEIAADAAPPRPRPGRPRNLSPAQLCAWLGVEARRDQTLDTVLLLRTASRAGVSVRPLSAGDAETRLLRCGFASGSASSSLFGSRFEPRVPDGLAEACGALAKGAACYDVELGVGTPPDELTRCLERLLARSS